MPGESACRLYVDAALGAGIDVMLPAAQAHYLVDVMRLTGGESIALFNGRDGEWIATLRRGARKSCLLTVARQSRPQSAGPDLWLLFAPIKRARLDYMAEKATELGVSRIQPVMTRYTQVTRVNTERLKANAVEAAEQSERLDVPEVRDALPLAAVLADWPSHRRILWCDESPSAAPIAAALVPLADTGRAPWAVLIGPEGGFAPEERHRLRTMPQVLGVNLGPRLLRADTAAIAALATWQASIGDWRGQGDRRDQGDWTAGDPRPM
jgi:16S rRNA (uracil1498-N3)-methyltransferase